MFGGGAGQIQDLAALFGGGRRAIDLYLTIGQSEDVRNEVIDTLKLVGPSGRYATLREARVKLEHQVDVQSLPGGVIEIEAHTHDPEESLQLAKSYTTAIAERLKRLNHQQLSTKRTLVDQRFREAATRLAEAGGSSTPFAAPIA
jgi:hypothetical protein